MQARWSPTAPAGASVSSSATFASLSGISGISASQSSSSSCLRRPFPIVAANSACYTAGRELQLIDTMGCEYVNMFAALRATPFLLRYSWHFTILGTWRRRNAFAYAYDIEQ